MIRKSFFIALVMAVAATSARAGLKPGDTAPDFSVQAAIGGKEFRFSLSEALKRGPVVLYFYPKSFTKGCTIEAHEFAENYDNFVAAGATLIGLSSDAIEVQRDFSAKECRDKFPVGADPGLSVINAYDAKRERPGASGETVADRISYVIAPDGKVVGAFADSNPLKHVEDTLAAVRKWRGEPGH
jgi:peroxiredoxin Q/BCP